MRKGLIFFAAFALIAYSISYSQFQKYEYGVISWYGDEFEGKRTASGEIYDSQKYTAAHKIFPFGSVILVENLENGRKVTLTINDRGPYAANRVLDVSKKAADDLGFLQKGTVYARITLLKLGNNKVAGITQGNATNESSSSSSPPAVIAAPPLPVQESSSSAPTNGKYEVVVTTNIHEVYSTNQIVMTNNIPIPVTNILNVEPYEEKLVENDLSAAESSNFKPDQFVLDESAIKNIPADRGTNVTYTEKEISPVSPVQNEIIPNKAALMTEKSNEGIQYVVQAGAFRSESSAMKLYNLLKKNNYDVFTSESTVNGKTWIRVKIGYFSTISEARSVSGELKKFRINALVLREKK